MNTICRQRALNGEQIACQWAIGVSFVIHGDKPPPPLSLSIFSWFLLLVLLFYYFFFYNSFSLFLLRILRVLTTRLLTERERDSRGRKRGRKRERERKANGKETATRKHGISHWFPIEYQCNCNRLRTNWIGGVLFANGLVLGIYRIGRDVLLITADMRASSKAIEKLQRFHQQVSFGKKSAILVCRTKSNFGNWISVEMRRRVPMETATPSMSNFEHLNRLAVPSNSIEWWWNIKFGKHFNAPLIHRSIKSTNFLDWKLIQSDDSIGFISFRCEFLRQVVFHKQGSATIIAQTASIESSNGQLVALDYIWQHGKRGESVLGFIIYVAGFSNRVLLQSNQTIFVEFFFLSFSGWKKNNIFVPH